MCGIIATGNLAGSSITGTDMTDTSTGVWLRDAQGIDVNNTLITASESFGLYANGTLTGSKFHDNLITGTTGVNGANGHAMSLAGAQGLAVYDNVGEDSFGAGIFVSGDTTGTTVNRNSLYRNRSGITLLGRSESELIGEPAEIALEPFLPIFEQALSRPSGVRKDSPDTSTASA